MPAFTPGQSGLLRHYYIVAGIGITLFSTGAFFTTRSLWRMAYPQQTQKVDERQEKE